MKILNEIPVDIKKGQMVSLDCEFFGQEKEKLHRPHGTFACISVAVEGRDDVYQLYDTHDLKKLFLSMKPGYWVGHNMLYDLKQLMKFTEIRPRTVWDTMLVEQSMYGGYYQHFGLKDLVRRYKGEVMSKEVRDEFHEATEMSPDMQKYAAKDALYTLDVAMTQRHLHEGTPGFAAYRDVDEKMIWPILDMQGARIDVGAWAAAVDEFESTATKLQDELGFNVMSGPQVLKALGKSGIHLLNTKAETLLEYTGTPIIDAILKTRMYRKAASTYGTKWLEKNVEADGKVYSSWHITGAETGRMSSANPNLQNIPSRKMPIYRTFFVASAGSVIIVDDVHQQEPCILAYESKDRILTDAILKGEDLHLTVAREIFNDPSLTKEDKDKRDVGKTINLGTSYGLSAQGAAKRLGISEDEAGKFIQQYFNRFSGVFTWINQMRIQAFQNGYIKTSAGRRVYMNTYSNQWQNNAINAPIQGGAADFTKMWIRKIWEKCWEKDIPYTLCLIVHDELGSDTPRPVVKQTNEIRKEAFDETARTLFPGIPMSSEFEMGKSWACKSMKEELTDDEEWTM